MLALKLSNSITGLGKTSFNTYSLDFNGTDEYVSVDGVGNDMNVATGTISLWAKIPTTSVTSALLKALYDLNNMTQIIYHASANELRFYYKGDGSSKYIAATDAIEGDGDWHHIAGTWDTDAGEIKLYLDGTLKATTTGITEMVDKPVAMDIAQNTAGGLYFDGGICEVAVFTRVVPIAELYTSRREPANLTGMSGLVGYWQFEEGSGTTTADSSGKGNTGTLFNTPTWSTDVPLYD